MWRLLAHGCRQLTLRRRRGPSGRQGAAEAPRTETNIRERKRKKKKPHDASALSEFTSAQPASGGLLHKMAKLKDKRREKVSVATEIDRLEERRARCQDNLERVEFRCRKEKLSEKDRQELEDEMAIINERVQKLDKELETLRRENRKNMLLSVALLALSALFYYFFFNNEEDS